MYIKITTNKNCAVVDRDCRSEVNTDQRGVTTVKKVQEKGKTGVGKA